MAIMPTIRIVICGYPKVGKSALAVRYLTRRFIGEYTSHTDLLYQYKTEMDGSHVTIEVLDCSRSKLLKPSPSWPLMYVGGHISRRFNHLPKREDGLPTERQVSCGDAYIVVYSVCDRSTFTPLPGYVQHLKAAKAPSYVPILLLGNKTDLDHCRQVSYDEGREMAHECGCLFQEVSAAESSQDVKMAFEDLINDAKFTLSKRSSKKIRRRNSWKTLSRALGSIFGRVSKSDSPTKITITAIS